MGNHWYSKEEVGILLKRKDDEHKIEIDMIRRLRSVEKNQDYSIHKRQMELKDKEIESLNKKCTYCFAASFVLASISALMMIITFVY